MHICVQDDQIHLKKSMAQLINKADWLSECCAGFNLHVDMSREYGGPKLSKFVKMTIWYWILANEFHYNLASEVCGQNYNLDLQGLG